jgi:hypothetical protein
VKRHTASPRGYDFEGVAEIMEIIGVLIEKDVSEPGAYDQTDGGVEDVILENRIDEAYLTGATLFLDKKVGSCESQDIHETVPADVERSNADDIWIDVGVGDHSGCLFYTGDLTWIRKMHFFKPG